MKVPFLSLKDVTAMHGEEIQAAVSRVVESGWYLQGEENARFEKDYAEYIGTKHCIGVANGLDALNEEMELDIEGLKAFLDEHAGERIFLFGFTFLIWQHFNKKLLETGYRPDLSQGVLIHGGGWKKLVQEQVSPAEFKQRLHEVCGIDPKNVHDY